MFLYLFLRLRFFHRYDFRNDSGRSWLQYIWYYSAFLTSKLMTTLCQCSPDVWSSCQRSNSLNILPKQTDNRFEHSPYSPSRIPLFRMILSDSQTYFCVCLKSPIFVHENDIWRFERILVRQKDMTVIYSLVKLCILRP